MKHKAARAKRRMQELTFGRFNVRTAAFKGVNVIGHIDLLLKICASKGCDVIGLQETKRDGVSEIVAAGYLLQRRLHRGQREESTTWSRTGDRRGNHQNSW